MWFPRKEWPEFFDNVEKTRQLCTSSRLKDHGTFSGGHEQHGSKETHISGQRIKAPSLLGLPVAGTSHYQFDSQKTTVGILLTPWRPQTPPQWLPGTPRGSLRLWKAEHSCHNSIKRCLGLNMHNHPICPNTPLPTGQAWQPW